MKTAEMTQGAKRKLDGSKEIVAQEVLIKIITKISTFEGRSKFRT